MSTRRRGGGGRRNKHENASTTPLTELVPARGAVFKGSFDTTQRAGTNSDSSLVYHILHRQNLLCYLFEGWDDVSVYKSAFIEGVGTMLFFYLSCLADVTFGQYGIYAPSWVGVTNVILLTVFIFAAAPSSGGHLNPLVTFSTFLTGLTPLPRAVLYMAGQLLGASVAGGLMLGTFNAETLRNKYHGGGCFFDHQVATVDSGQAFVIEMMSSFALMFLSFGCALDPRQAIHFGPVLGPLLVGISLGICSFASSGLSEGYAGAGMNPARCFAFGVSRRSFDNQWIWWFGAATGAILHAIVYRAVPPYHARKLEALPTSTSDIQPPRESKLANVSSDKEA